MKCKASYMSQWDGSKLKTVGVLLLGPSALVYYAPKEHHSAARELNQQLSMARTRYGWSNEDLFTQRVQSGNGLTLDWSFPFDAAGSDMEEIAANIVYQIG